PRHSRSAFRYRQPVPPGRRPRSPAAPLRVSEAPRERRGAPASRVMLQIRGAGLTVNVGGRLETLLVETGWPSGSFESCTGAGKIDPPFGDSSSARTAPTGWP